MYDLQVQLRAVLFIALIAMFCGSIGTMLWMGPDRFQLDRTIITSSNKNDPSGSVNLDKIETTMELLEENYVLQVDRQKLLAGAINGMVAALDDPYTVYMDKAQSKSFQDSLESSFEGIGAEVATDGDKIKVVSPIKGSPAERAGIKPNDRIISVNGETLVGLDLFEAIKKIRGPKGTQAKLQIERAGVSEPITIVVVRDTIPIETVQAKMLPGKIGKIEISQFSFDTAEHFATELELLESDGMKALVIDLRNNPGGLLDQVQLMLENFVPAGKVMMQVKAREGESEKIVSEGDSKPYPVAVLINEGSASASEIMAAGLKETIGSKLIGITTFGKGSVQTTFEEEMNDGSNIKITIAKWLTPKGNTIHKKGVKPDLEVQQPDYFDVKPLAFEKTWKLDMVGDDIESAQLMLKGLGFHKGRTDGYFDQSTETSLKNFQQTKKMLPTGQLDKTAAIALQDSVIEAIRDEKNDVQLKQAVEVVKKQINK